MNDERIHVVAGILVDSDGSVLIAARDHDRAMAGKWEFPGGKIADGESPEHALRRELNEEIGITAGAIEPYTRLSHRYPDRHVELEFFLVRDWQGRPRSCEGQRLKWIHPRDIDDGLLLDADAPVLQKLREQPAANPVKSF